MQLAMQQFQKLDTTNQEITFFSWWRHSSRGSSISVGPGVLGRHHGNLRSSVPPRRGTNFASARRREKTDRAGHDEHKQIWIPDTIIYDAVESVFQVPGLVQPNVYSDGSVFQSVPVETRLPCPMQPRTFPFDQQECPVQFGCWSTHGLQVDVKPRWGNNPEKAVGRRHFALRPRCLLPGKPRVRFDRSTDHGYRFHLQLLSGALPDIKVQISHEASQRDVQLRPRGPHDPARRWRGSWRSSQIRNPASGSARRDPASLKFKLLTR